MNTEVNEILDTGFKVSFQEMRNIRNYLAKAKL